MVSSRLIALGFSVMGLLALTGCGAPSVSPGASGTASASPSASADATPSNPAPTPVATEESPTPAPFPVNIPQSCDALGSPQTRAATVDTLTFQDVQTRPADGIPADAVKLSCYWFAGDVSGVTAAIAQPSAAEAEAAIEGLRGSGYDCVDTGRGTACRGDEMASYGETADYPVMYRVAYQDGVWMEISGSNIDVETFTTEVQNAIWG